MTWEEAAAELREALLSSDFVRAVANTGTQRVTVRPIEVKSGPALQIVTEDGVRPTTKTVPVTKAAIEPLLDERYRNWHVETARQTVKVQISKKGRVLLSKGGPPTAPVTAAKGHDREKQHLLDPGDPLFDVIGGDARKRRQVDAFLRALDAALPAEVPDRLRVVDLGCGNAYLTFAAYRHLTERGLDVHLTGVDVREDQRERNTRLAAELGFEKVDFVAGTILDAKVEGAVDVVLALHACDTATDEALARAIEWDARWILAAPCCHKDISRQLRKGTETALTRSGILRERFADVLTDSLRSAILRDQGYAVDVVEFVDSAHTPRNLLLKATKPRATKAADAASGNSTAATDDYQSLVAEWGVRPHLAELLHRIP